MKEKKIVQGTYITETALGVLGREAQRQKSRPATVASEILERELKKIQKREEASKKAGGENAPA